MKAKGQRSCEAKESALVWEWTQNVLDMGNSVVVPGKMKRRVTVWLLTSRMASRGSEIDALKGYLFQCVLQLS